MITVIIPSYNRAHLLKRTIPTYLQEGVSKVILVDDCSTDDTEAVVKEMLLHIPELEYIRLSENSKQAFAKNVGINMVDTPWIYFGDDDSILYDNCIPILYETCLKHQADICGAKALYMDQEDERIEFHEVVRKYDINLPTGKKLCDLERLEANFIYSVANPQEVPFVQASALVKASLAKNVMFDSGYLGNGYREETDFFVRCIFLGAKIMFNSNAVQINLPRSVSSGGSHASGRLAWYKSTIKNNHRFLKKNWGQIQKKYQISKSSVVVELQFVSDLLLGAIKNISKSLWKR
ncbi:glycosyltransferase family 2 protein [Sphingobacterium multivorum]|uniref:Poly-beta-1,6-N-acetyl-D-glucosamine synthase n=1 Tax=Sphingobacterium multivorum TaxID=28454 RepID=A0A2X2J857_SPHMU|nr:glycosyltransferase family 2 protein [Sphingobacterium multivorum]QRQ61178.1 glycosyltransferase family 2 protein [Sphingobacterium multivorum]SPZ88421.1 Poly-beta-1,6-N-acetyl-D-glucosamine synthase [Sphingobacterium multivorum]